MKRWALVLMVPALLLLAACGVPPLVSMGQQDEQSAQGKAAEEAQPVELSVDNDGQTITLQSGQELQVKLAGNPTTGYAWEVSEMDAAVLRITGEGEYVPAGEALGSGGEFVFNFQAAAPGETSLTLIYYRSFEKDVPPKHTFSVRVVVSQ